MAERKTKIKSYEVDNNVSEEYASRQLKTEIDNLIRNHIKVPSLEIHPTEAPLQTGFDYGVNLNPMAGGLHISPVELSTKLAKVISRGEKANIAEVVGVGPFINFKVDMEKFGSEVVNQILNQGKEYGKENIGKSQRVVIDMSSPNIAKRMSYPHLRSTIIGDSLSKLYTAKGYEVIRDNHLGDWGTQFGKLIVAIKKWGDEGELLRSTDPIGGLQTLYVRFETESVAQTEKLRKSAKEKIAKKGYNIVPNLQNAIENVSQELMKRKQIGRNELDMSKVVEDALDRVIESDLVKEGRQWFLKLEQGDPEAKRLWKICVDLSIKEFNQMYKVLDVKFEKTLGESFYESMLKGVADKVRRSKAGKISKGALVVDMEDVGLGIAIVQKSDGASLYLTRDLACAIYREEKMHADKAVYVVGGDQIQYFQQLFEVLRRLGYRIGETAEHVYFGMVSLPEGKMSTRKGRVILLKDVIQEGLKRAGQVLEKKNPELSKNKYLKANVTRQIAIGALKWNDLNQDPKKAIIFDWDKALNFDGNSAPYVQYTAVRANSILESGKKKFKDFDFESTADNSIYSSITERALVRQLAEFPNVIQVALDSNSPAKIANYVYELSKRFNSFYVNTPVLRADNESLIKSRLKLVAATYQVIQNSLSLLGIEIPEKM